MQNLWPEFNDLQPASESAGSAQKQKTFRSRHPSEQVVLSLLREWLLHDYIALYCRSLAATRIFRHCYWVDGLGGNPILQRTLLISQELESEPKPISLHYLALQSKRSKRKETNAARSIILPKGHGLVHASWQESSATLLQAIDQSAAIFLLNPFGNHGLFSFEDLAPLYLRTAPTELCLLIAHKQVETSLLPLLRT